MSTTQPALDRSLLTDREAQILTMIAQGCTSRQIGAILTISYKTADAHRENIKKKLRLNGIAELVMAAIKLKLIEVK